MKPALPMQGHGRDDERKSQDRRLHRADRQHRLGLCEQQHRPGRRHSRPDQSGACRPGARLGWARGNGVGCAQARRAGEEIDHRRIHRLSRGREEIQVAQAPPAHPVQHHAGAIPREMGSGARLSHGGAQLRGRAVAAGAADGPRPAAAPAQQIIIRGGEDVSNKRCAVFAASLLVGLIAPALAQEPSAVPGVVAPGVEPQLVQEGFKFTEGPVGTAEGTLYFSDIRANRTYLLETGGKISVVRENTNGANGLALTADGHLLAAEGEGKRISRLDRDGKVTTVTHGTEDRPFLAPNDLIVDAKGGIYFTDPGPRPVVPGRIVYVYYLPPGAKEPIVIDDKIARPNGLTI